MSVKANHDVCRVFCSSARFARFLVLFGAHTFCGVFLHLLKEP